MPQAIGDPDELSKFANQLAEYLNTLDTETSNLRSNFETLGDSWRDEKRAAFEEQFTALMAQIEQFKSSCDEQIPYLHNLAERLRDYLNS